MPEHPRPGAASGRPSGGMRAGAGARTWARSDLLRLLVVAAAYYGGAKLGLSLAFENGSISAIWPPTGIAIGALVLWGRRMWPAVFLGAFLANAFSASHLPVWAAGLIATGNTLEALTAAVLLGRAGFRPGMSRVSDVTALCTLAAGVSTLVSATVGVATLAAAGALDGASAGFSWRLWWLGDMGGALIVAPLILVLGCTRVRPTRRQVTEGAVIFTALAILCVLTFAVGTPIAYLAFPVLIVAAFRLGQPGSVLASLLLAGVAIPFTARGYGQFAGSATDASLLLSQTFVAAGAVTALVLSALMSERRRVQSALEGTRDDLVASVAERNVLLERQGRELSAAQELDRAKNDLLALVSHDLRTPLTAIRGYTQLLLTQDGLDERGRRYAGVIDRNGERLMRLVEDLLVVGQHQIGAFTINAVEVDLAGIVRDGLVSLQPEARRKWLVLRGPAADPVVVRGDRERLARMFDNLAANAIKYGRMGGEVSVSLTVTGDRARLAVRDDGPGIPLDEQPMIFDRFTRTRDALAGGAHGFGLGLAIARAISEAHDGRIGVQGAPGSGSTFWVDLPLAGPAARGADTHPDVRVRAGG